VALACSTIHEPPLLFLDEPTAGVDPVSRREFWDQIHRISAGGTTVLLTTHYMDEAERCHRLAFIFGGELLDTGTPAEIVARRGLSAAEFTVKRSLEAADLLRADARVDAVAHYGHTLRVTARGPDATALLDEVLKRAGFEMQDLQPARVSVEDAFVSMVRDEQKRASRAAA
jgi:ABC-2 type transport system ATP-binding protein